MAGTHEGGKKAAETAKERHGEDFHERIGEKGGERSHGGRSSSQDDESRYGSSSNERNERNERSHGEKSQGGRKSQEDED